MKFKILAVDDNPINLKLLQRTLLNSNYIISTAESGKEALKKTREIKPDLILLDVLMPDLSGYEVCKKLQEDESTKDIPVIFLSAKNEPVDKVRGLALGAVDYLTKPFDTLEINARVRTHLSVRQNSIKLQYEKEGLLSKLRQVSERYGTVEGSHAISAFINKINSAEYYQEYGRFEFASLQKNKVEPVTIKLIPFLKSESHLFFLLLNGFEKNYSTVIIHLLFEKYFTGFLDALPEKEIRHERMLELVKNLMDNFSPDIYKTAFSFAVGSINPAMNKLFYYSLQEEQPFIISSRNEAAPGVDKTSGFYLEFDNLLQVSTIDLQKNDTICLCRKKGRLEYTDLYKEYFIEAFKSEGRNLQQKLADIAVHLKSSDGDQLLAAVTVK